MLFFYSILHFLFYLLPVTYLLLLSLPSILPLVSFFRHPSLFYSSFSFLPLPVTFFLFCFCILLYVVSPLLFIVFLPLFLFLILTSSFSPSFPSSHLFSFFRHSSFLCPPSFPSSLSSILLLLPSFHVPPPPLCPPLTLVLEGRLGTGINPTSSRNKEHAKRFRSCAEGRGRGSGKVGGNREG